MRRVHIFGIVAASLSLFGAGLVVGANQYHAPTTIIHVSTIKWKAEATADQKSAALEGVKKMAAEIPGMKNVWIKATKVQPSGYTSAFAIEFESKAAAEAYVNAPAHKDWEKIYLPYREESINSQITN